MGINKITIINVNPELTGTDKELIANVTKSDKVEVINNAKTLEVIGDDFKSFDMASGQRANFKSADGTTYMKDSISITDKDGKAGI